MFTDEEHKEGTVQPECEAVKNIGLMMGRDGSPTPQFKSINSVVLSFLYSPTLNPYMTTGKTVVLTRWTFVSKVMSLLFNMLSRLAIAFLPRSKHLLISWLQSPLSVILEPKKIKSITVSPSICHEVMSQMP